MNRIAIEKGISAGYNLRNSKIIEWLDITRGEQQHLITIIDGLRRGEGERKEKGKGIGLSREKKRERGDIL